MILIIFQKDYINNYNEFFNDANLKFNQKEIYIKYDFPNWLYLNYKIEKIKEEEAKLKINYEKKEAFIHPDSNAIKKKLYNIPI